MANAGSGENKEKGIMARYYFSEDSDPWKLYQWLKGRPWVKNDRTAAYLTGYYIGVQQEIMNIWNSNMWSRRKLGTFKTVWWRERLTREFTEVFYRNGEGFVDVIIVHTPEVAWRYDWKGNEIKVEVKL